MEVFWNLLIKLMKKEKGFSIKKPWNMKNIQCAMLPFPIRDRKAFKREIKIAPSFNIFSIVSTLSADKANLVKYFHSCSARHPVRVSTRHGSSHNSSRDPRRAIKTGLLMKNPSLYRALLQITPPAFFFLPSLLIRTDPYRPCAMKSV